MQLIVVGARTGERGVRGEGELDADRIAQNQAHHKVLKDGARELGTIKSHRRPELLAQLDSCQLGRCRAGVLDAGCCRRLIQSREHTKHLHRYLAHLATDEARGAIVCCVCRRHSTGVGCAGAGCAADCGRGRDWRDR